MPDTLEETTTLWALDFDPELACEAINPTCERPADWVQKCGLCGIETHFCDPCWREILDDLIMAKSLGLSTRCFHCGVVVDPDGAPLVVPVRGLS